MDNNIIEIVEENYIFPSDYINENDFFQKIFKISVKYAFLIVFILSLILQLFMFDWYNLNWQSLLNKHTFLTFFCLGAFVSLWILNRNDKLNDDKVFQKFVDIGEFNPRIIQFMEREIHIYDNFGMEVIIPYCDVAGYSVSESKELLRVAAVNVIYNFNISSFSEHEYKLIRARLDKYAVQFVKNGKFKSFWGTVKI